MTNRKFYFLLFITFSVRILCSFGINALLIAKCILVAMATEQTTLSGETVSSFSLKSGGMSSTL